MKSSQSHEGDFGNIQADDIGTADVNFFMRRKLQVYSGRTIALLKDKDLCSGSDFDILDDVIAYGTFAAYKIDDFGFNADENSRDIYSSVSVSSTTREISNTNANDYDDISVTKPDKSDTESNQDKKTFMPKPKLFDYSNDNVNTMPYNNYINKLKSQNDDKIVKVKDDYDSKFSLTSNGHGSTSNVKMSDKYNQDNSTIANENQEKFTYSIPTTYSKYSDNTNIKSTYEDKVDAHDKEDQDFEAHDENINNPIVNDSNYDNTYNKLFPFLTSNNKDANPEQSYQDQGTAQDSDFNSDIEFNDPLMKFIQLSKSEKPAKGQNSKSLLPSNSESLLQMKTHIEQSKEDPLFSKVKVSEKPRIFYSSISNPQ